MPKVLFVFKKKRSDKTANGTVMPGPLALITGRTERENHEKRSVCENKTNLFESNGRA
jgi:hypothetical protein